MDPKMLLSEALEKGYTRKKFDPMEYGECLMGQAYIYATKTTKLKSSIYRSEILEYWPWLNNVIEVPESLAHSLGALDIGESIMSFFGFRVAENDLTVQEPLKWLKSIGQ